MHRAARPTAPGTGHPARRGASRPILGPTPVLAATLVAHIRTRRCLYYASPLAGSAEVALSRARRPRSTPSARSSTTHRIPTPPLTETSVPIRPRLDGSITVAPLASALARAASIQGTLGIGLGGERARCTARRKVVTPPTAQCVSH